MTRWTARPALLALATLLAVGACGGEEAPEAEPVDEAATEAPASPAEGGTMDEAGAMDGALLDPGTATREELVAIEGMDEALADALIEGRPYDDMLAVDAVLAGSLDETQREEVYRHLWKPLDLNEATAEEILLIPGVGDRMLHEFEEYRPYEAMAEFEREIGKYVDEEEVARLARYVEIR